RVVQAQALDVERGEVDRLEERHHLAQRRGIRSREYPMLHEGAELERAVAADGGQEATAVRGQRAIDDSREVAGGLAPHVLEQPHGYECTVGPVPVTG